MVTPLPQLPPPEFEPKPQACCATCQHRRLVEQSEFVALDQAKRMRAMGKRLGFKGDKFAETGKWLKVSWTEPQCKFTNSICLPDNVTHNCPFIK